MTAPAVHTYRSLDALRGVAALGVVLFHSAFVVQGQGPVLENASLFVDFFFVLSGFVMAHAYTARIARGGDLSGFVALRLGRLYPMHLLMLVAWVVYYAATLPPTDRAFGHHMAGILPHLTMLNSVGLQERLSLNYPTWSVGAEFWGSLLFFFVVAGLRQRFGAWTALALTLVCYAALLADGAGTIQRSYDLGLVRCLGGFFLGVTLQCGLSARRDRPLGTGAEVTATGAALVLLALPAGYLAVELATVAAFAGVVAVFARSEGALSRVLQARLPVFLGRISYSIYMVHALIWLLAVDLARLVRVPAEAALLTHPVHKDQFFLLTPWAPMINVFAVAIVIGVAALTYRYVEEPARQATRRWVRARPRTGLVPSG
ncbi:MAG: acyltransferase [Rhodobacter sp.]|nr:acyltransferase [Rhodobacter sp.]